MIQDQTNRKDAGKPRYDLIPTEYWEAERGIDDSRAAGSFHEELDGLIRFWRGGDEDELFLPNELDEIDGVCRVLEFGAKKKYSPNGWEKQPLTYSRVYRSALAHAVKHLRNHNGGLDEETGEPHTHHFRCNVLFLWTYHTRGLAELDDRPKGIVYGGVDDGPKPATVPPPARVIPEVGKKYKLVKAHPGEEDSEGRWVGRVGVILRFGSQSDVCRYEFDPVAEVGESPLTSQWIGKDAVFEAV